MTAKTLQNIGVCHENLPLFQLLKIHLRSHQTVEVKEEDGEMNLKQESKTCPLCSKVQSPCAWSLMFAVTVKGK